MCSSANVDPAPSPFPFISLPIDLQERILSFLPVSSLLPLLSVSRSFLRLLRSPTFPSPPPDLFFLLFSPASPPFSSLLSFHPSSLLLSSHPFATSSSLAVSTSPPAGPDDGQMLIAVRLFSCLPPQEIPPMIPVGDPYVLAVIPDADVAPSCPSDHFKIVAASSWKYGVFSQALGVITAIRVLKLNLGENDESLKWREISVLSETDEVLIPPCWPAPKDVKWYGHATEMGLEVLRLAIA